MMTSQIDITAHAVQTARHTYKLRDLTVVSVSRPFLPMGLLFALGGVGFGISCFDLLYPGELAALAVGIVVALWTGLTVAQIQLLSRDLRGSELSGMVWGTYGHLQRVRYAIADAMATVSEDKT